MVKVFKILLETLPILLMIGLIPFVSDDYVLTVLYVAVIGVALAVRRERHDFLIFVFGFIMMTISEYLFVSTGVETFLRNSLFGLMPLWLPFLWGYGFVVIKRSVLILS